MILNQVDMNISNSCEGGRVMSEIKIKENESLDNALKRFRDNVPVLELLERLGKESIMKNLALKGRRNQKRLEERNILDINKKRIYPTTIKLF